MAVTIKEIAKVAGVSRGTVDRALNDRGGVNPEIERKIKQIAEDMGYQPNKAAKALSFKKDPLKIGFFLPSIGNVFFDDVIQGAKAAEKNLLDFGVKVRFKTISGYRISEHLEAIQELVASKCDGLCLCTIDTPAIREYVSEVIRSGVPVITVNTDLSFVDRLCYIGSNYVKAGKTAAGIFSMMNKNETVHVLVANGSRNIKGHVQRYSGFLDTLSEKKIAYELLEIMEVLDQDDIAYQLTKDFLCRNERVDCIVVVASGVNGVCRAVREAGLKKKHHTVLIAFDDVKETRKWIASGVVDFSICQEPYVQGYKAVDLLFSYFLSNRKLRLEDQYTNLAILIKENL